MFFTKFFKDEQNILKIIRYQPMVLMLVIVLIMIQVSIQQVNENFSNEINKVRQDYLDQNKKRVKEEVKRVLYEVEIEKSKSESYLKEKIKLQVDNAYQIIQSIYNKNKNTKSKQEIIKDIKNALQNIRFNNGRGYIFIYDLDATSIFHPTKPQREGKNYFYDKDITGVYRNQIAANIVKEKGEGFFHWFFHKPNDATTEYKKIGFVKGFKEYNWFIGTGEYVLDYENEMKRRILDGINNIKFGDNGYIFVLDKQGEVLSHPLKTLRNKNAYDKKNSRGEYFIQDIISFSNEKKEGFLTHYSSIVPNILNNKDSYKISYIEYYDSWEWIVGSGFYQDILEVNIAEKKELLESIKKSSIKKIIEVGIVVMVILIIISFYISKVLNNIFTKYKKSVTRQMQRTLQKEKLLIQQSKMATMGEMIGSIAHQWKQPLSLIGMSNALIRLSKESEGFTTEKEVKEAIDDIDISVNNLAQTIDDFRNFFNPNKQKKYFRFNEVFDKTNKLISSQFKNDDIEFIKNIEDKELFTFENELSQVLINILKNAKEELIKLDSDIKRFIFVDAIFEDDIYVIRIKDNAGGIPDEIFTKIFDSYFTTKEVIGGTGIGLYISKKIVEENMCGTLEVKNVEFIYKDIEYKGAEFSMYIPI